MLPDYTVIGRRIRATRIERKMTQEELADKLDVSIAFMSRVERGNSQINLRRLIQIAEILNVSPGYLLTGSNVNSKDYLKEDFRILLEKCTPEKQRLIYKISELVSNADFLYEDDFNIKNEGDCIYARRFIRSYPKRFWEY